MHSLWSCLLFILAHMLLLLLFCMYSILSASIRKQVSKTNRLNPHDTPCSLLRCSMATPQACKSKTT